MESLKMLLLRKMAFPSGRMVISMVSTNLFFAVLEMDDQNMASATSNTSSRATIH
jgi:hypothetical protein